jgi:hypothetical protein
MAFTDRLYRVLIWDADDQRFVSPNGLGIPTDGISIHGLRRVLFALRGRGYPCGYCRNNNKRVIGDPSVLVERIDNVRSVRLRYCTRCGRSDAET